MAHCDNAEQPEKENTNMKIIMRIAAAAATLALTACSTSLVKQGETFDRINQELNQAAASRQKAVDAEAVQKALLPPLAPQLPPDAAKPMEPRFDLAVNNAPASQVFMAIVSGTRYSMLVHPEVSGNVTVNLKDVTVREALDTLRELYGYEYKVLGTRIMIQPIALQTRVFQVNYLAGRRRGQSDVRVSSGSISAAPTSQTGGAVLPTPTTAGTPGTMNAISVESSRIATSSDTDFWQELSSALKTLVGTEAGRNVVISQHSGVIIVRGFPGELRNVEIFLKATQLVVERQVMLEAKIIEVQLNDGFQTGVNWSAFRRGNTRASFGMLNPGTVLQPNGAIGTGSESVDVAARTFTNPTLSSTPGTDFVGGTLLTAGVFGLALQTGNFAALLSFLETQGTVQVLSSPRIATLNNQKAVLKVGTDEFFITNISTSTTASGNTTTTSPTITVQPFFSGIALDVTPQIDENSNIILHIHPSVSVVSEKEKSVNLGQLGNFVLPLASSNINETDSIVRVQDGNIVAIGGLMKQQQSEDKAQAPGVGDIPLVGALFGQKSKSFLKREIVILLKPTVILGEHGWQQDALEVQGRLQAMNPRRPAAAQQQD